MKLFEKDRKRLDKYLQQPIETIGENGPTRFKY